jgi:DNA-binding protein HU-beta
MPKILDKPACSRYKGISTVVRKILYGRKTKRDNTFRRSNQMNKLELIAAVADEANLSKKDAEAAVKAFTDTITKELVRGQKVQLVGFGTFEVTKRPAREGRNPKTGASMKIAACKAPKFKAGKALKDVVNKKK